MAIDLNELNFSQNTPITHSNVFNRIAMFKKAFLITVVGVLVSGAYLSNQNKYLSGQILERSTIEKKRDDVGTRIKSDIYELEKLKTEMFSKSLKQPIDHDLTLK
jgi:hypothetical protein